MTRRYARLQKVTKREPIRNWLPTAHSDGPAPPDASSVKRA